MATSAVFQHTLRAPVAFEGVGLHSGQVMSCVLRPAAAGAGISFIRTDLAGDNRIPARAEAVTRTQLGTVIGNAAGAEVSTIEHLMSAFAALGVDNAVVELDGPELPIMDGSAGPFVELIDRAGLKRQDAPRRYIEILEPIEAVDGDKSAALVPADQFEMAFEIDFKSAAIGGQRIDMVLDEAAFREGVAESRTFGFLHEVEALRKAGLARGGSMDNCLVIDGDELMNPEGLRSTDEFVRHKALDALGDLYLLGAPIIGRFEGVLAGHTLNNALARALLARPEAWRTRLYSEALAEAV
ncbi:MAG TPA: UDP-3-O-acyl-N-acetylglucosamine deacetylase [Caulobacteraceae bacterium]|nr:UDP-3-O-acyl-N-acetylglucosamine deacetylase [Caulobacteraceae bacterium]